MSWRIKAGDRVVPPVAASRRGPVAFLAAVALWFASASASAQVLVVLSDASMGYETVAAELRSGLQPLRGGHLRIDTVTAARLTGVGAPTFDAYELVVTVGLAAAQGVMSREDARAKPPLTLCLLIPRQSFERLASSRASERERRLSALFIDQPLSRQLDLLRIALPEKRRVGVILGPTSQELAGELRDQAQARTLHLTVATVNEPSGVYAALQTVIPESEMLLLLPDPAATNADTVYGLLVTSYRAQVPVVGFSEGLLNAGALVSLFSTAGQQGRQGAEIATRILTQGGGLPAPQYPKYFTVRVNASVARSLGLHLPSQEALQTALGDGGRAADVPGAATRDGATLRGEP